MIAGAFSFPIESLEDSRIGLVLIHAFCPRGGWRAWPDPYQLTFCRRLVGAIEGGLS
jgi:hypothetical protein